MKKIALVFATVCLAGSVLAQTTPTQPATSPTQTPVPSTIPANPVPPATPPPTTTDPVQSPAGNYPGGQYPNGNKQDGIQGRDSAGTFEQRIPGQTTMPASITPANRSKTPRNRPARRDSLR